jgi:hypothetical protein
MRVKNAPDQGSPRGSKGHVGYATIVWASLAADKSFFFESIDSGSDRSAGEHNVSSNRIDRERAFMQKNFQDRKVRDAEPGRGDTPGIDLSESAVSLHQNEPEMDAGSVGRAGIRIVHGIIFISRYFPCKFFCGKGFKARELPVFRGLLSGRFCL